MILKCIYFYSLLLCLVSFSMFFVFKFKKKEFINYIYSLSVAIQKKKIKSNVSKPWQQNLSYERVFGESLMKCC